MQNKTHWRKLYDPDYLGAYSLDKDGKYTDMVVTIKQIRQGKIKGTDGKETEEIMADMVNQKPMVLNATNCKTIEKLYGPHIEDWAGKKITLYVAKVRAFGDMHECLRVRDKVPANEKQPTLPDLNPKHENWAMVRTAFLGGNTTIERLRGKYSITAENEALLTKPGAPSVTIDELSDLFDIKRDSLPLDKVKEINQIINDKVESKYSETHEFLKTA